MLPAWLAPPPVGLAGEAMAVDAGGTNLRAARVRVDAAGAHQVGPVASVPLPGAAGRPAASAQAFWDAHVEVLRAAGARPGMPLGYCFSYPIESHPDGDAELLRWTKEVRVADLEGSAVGAGLADALARAGLAPGPVVVLNDTIAALMGGAVAAGDDPGHAIGLIVGTGTNMGAFLPARALTKLGAAGAGWERMAVNFESGAFTPPGLTPADADVDVGSGNPGAQRFEKAVSGAYLGLVYAAAAARLGLPVPADRSTRAVSEAAAGGQGAEGRLARALLDRSADLVAASLAAAADAMGGGATLTVCAEGTLFWEGPGYAARVGQTLDALLAETGCGPARIVATENANLLGSAAAALTRR